MAQKQEDTGKNTKHDRIALRQMLQNVKRVGGTRKTEKYKETCRQD